jgi:hypothetical protein
MKRSSSGMRTQRRRYSALQAALQEERNRRALDSDHEPEPEDRIRARIRDAYPSTEEEPELPPKKEEDDLPTWQAHARIRDAYPSTEEEPELPPKKEEDDLPIWQAHARTVLPLLRELLPLVHELRRLESRTGYTPFAVEKAGGVPFLVYQFTSWREIEVRTANTQTLFFS